VFSVYDMLVKRRYVVALLAAQLLPARISRRRGRRRHRLRPQACYVPRALALPR
jgi:hypothetical protein